MFLFIYFFDNSMVFFVVVSFLVYNGGNEVWTYYLMLTIQISHH